MARKQTILPENDPKVLDAAERASRYLADGNEQADRRKAEKLYDKAQFWHDRYNRYTGRA